MRKAEAVGDEREKLSGQPFDQVSCDIGFRDIFLSDFVKPSSDFEAGRATAADKLNWCM